MKKPFHYILLAVSGILAFCADSAVAQDIGRPDYYPAEYATIVEASKIEGQLLIYSNMAEFNWAPVIVGFNKLYPWIKVQSVNLQSAEVFTRYNIEAGSGAKTADLLATGSIEGWMNFHSSGNILDYTSPEAGKLPNWSKPFPGLYTVSTDPMILVYNKKTVPESDWPKSMADLAKTVEKHPEYRKSIVTYNGLSAFGAPVHWSWLKRGGDTALAELRAIGPATVQEESVGTMVTKLSSGEYRIGYFVSGIGVFPKLDGALGRLLGWSFPADGAPVMLRGIAVPKKATNVNAAKLMLDFVVSRSGQMAFGEGGLTPYREDVQPGGKIHSTYQSIEKQVGADKMIVIGYDPAFLAGKAEFETLWKKTTLQ